MSDLSNPYASPAIPADLSANAGVTTHEVRIASQGKRFLNLIVDNIIIQVLSGAAGFIAGIVFAVTANGPLSKDADIELQAIGFLIGLLVALSYYIGTEALFQRTLAKFLTSTRVVNVDGQRPTFGQIVGRNLARFIPFEAFSFLGIKPVGWHDSLSGTRVIDSR